MPQACRPAMPEAYRVALEDRLRAKIVQLLERSVGLGKVDAAVSVDLDFDEVATTAEHVRPAEPGRCAAPRPPRRAAIRRKAQPATAVGAAGNLPTERAASTEHRLRQAATRRKKTEETRQLRDLAHGAQPDQARRVDPAAVDRGAGRRRLQQGPTARLELRAARRRGADTAGGSGAQCCRRRREPRRRGRGGEPPVRDAAPAESEAEPGWQEALTAQYGRFVDLGVLSVLTLASCSSACARRCAACWRPCQPPAPPPSSTAVVLGADGKPLLVHGATGSHHRASIGPAIPWWFARRSRPTLSPHA